jgi:hypothetical protein
MTRAGRMLGRYERVRWLHAVRGYSRPFILDRHTATLAPYEGTHEWADQRDRREQRRAEIAALARGVRSERWVPVYATGIQGSRQAPKMILGFSGTAALAQTALALSNTYANNTVATSACARLFLAVAHGNLDAIYYYVTASAGSPTSIYAEVTTTDATLTNPRATTTIRTSGTDDPTADATMVAWHQLVPTAYSPVVETQWIILGNTTGTPGSNNVTVAVGIGESISAPVLNRGGYDAYTATAINNTTVNMTALLAWPGLVLKFNDGAVFGVGCVTLVTPASNTNRKGWRLPGLTDSLRVYAVSTALALTTSGVEISADTAAPGTFLINGTMQLGTTTAIGYMLSAPYTLQRATPYRIVVTFSGASTGPQAYSTGTLNGFTDVSEARLFGSGSHYAIANGTTNWSNDDTTSIPHMALLVEDQGAPQTGWFV